MGAACGRVSQQQPAGHSRLHKCLARLSQSELASASLCSLVKHWTSEPNCSWVFLERETWGKKICWFSTLLTWELQERGQNIPNKMLRHSKCNIDMVVSQGLLSSGASQGKTSILAGMGRSWQKAGCAQDTLSSPEPQSTWLFAILLLYMQFTEFKCTGNRMSLAIALLFSSFCWWKFLISLTHKIAGRAACYQSWQAGGAEDVLSCVILDKGEMAQSSTVKRQFSHKGLRKGNLADNKWIGGRREHQSFTTDTYYFPWKYSWGGGGDGGPEFAESKADGSGSERAVLPSQQKDNLQGTFRVCLHIYLSQSSDKRRISLLYKWCFVVIYLLAYTNTFIGP